MEPFTAIVKSILKKIPRGKVATYGQIAALAGNPRAARQVVRILHSSTEKDKLPWHRVVNSQRKIGLRPGSGYELQQALLKKEGVSFGIGGRIDFERFQWRPLGKRKAASHRD
ncbi:DNA methyltransferase [candidate division GN15 bacterium]|uniref:DNA methyltransferase n=1 Tax=candidate division GN15 bacterium TaxID=2072418 RepID=A0A855WWR7_9BACT|nr:MAG: DNA methyltransferase [candidate division GN15 bacterium]